MNGLVVLPSLDRPEELLGFFKAYADTESAVPGMILIDKADFKDRQLEYEAIALPVGWEYKITGDARSMGDKIRYVWEDIKGLDWVMILNDDHRPRTKNWDQKVLGHMRSHLIISTNDGATQDKPWNAGKRLCGAITIGGDILRALGYMFPEGLHHFYSDDVWGHLGSRAGCIMYLSDVCVEHEHAYLHEKKRDKTFDVVNGTTIMDDLKTTGQGKGGYWEKDRAAIQTWLRERLEIDAKKIVALQPKVGVMIATPFHSQTSSVAVDYMMGIMDSALGMAQHNIHFEFARIEGSSLVPHARNSLVDMFLASKCQKFLFIDSDQGFSRNQVFTLLNSSRPIVCGVVPHKRFPMNLNFEPLADDMKYFPENTNKSSEEFFKFAKERADAKGEIEVNRSGSGFMMIDRSVFELMKDQVDKYYPFDDRKVEHHYEFFKMGAMEGHYRGEDWLFCVIAKKLGIPIYINTHCLVTHWGAFRYAIDESKRIA